MTHFGPPKQIALSPFAISCLKTLSEAGLGKTISLGGAFGLNYYHAYRVTHDIDAWWNDDGGDDSKDAVITCLMEALKPYGDVKIRKWNDVVSIELTPPEKKHVEFSFQIARRSARLTEPTPLPGIESLQLDSLIDLIASKMTALVERGAPRDFLDIFSLCHTDLITPHRCWELWRQRQEMISEHADFDRARTAIQTHLARLAVSRPLHTISEPGDRVQAETIRNWFEKDFLDAISH